MVGSEKVFDADGRRIGHGFVRVLHVRHGRVTHFEIDDLGLMS